MMGPNGQKILESPTKKENSNFVASSIPVRVLGYRIIFYRILATSRS